MSGENGLVVIRYENKDGLLLVAGPQLDKQTISEMPLSKWSYHPAGCEGAACGRASILVGSEGNAQVALHQLTSYFEEKGISVDYRGHTAVPNGRLEDVKSIRGLCTVVLETLQGEALGTVDTEELQVIDYMAVASQLPQNDPIPPPEDKKPKEGLQERATRMLSKGKEASNDQL